MSEGLSPPTRGSRVRGPRFDPCNGSIPAHTGKPRRTGAESTRAAVYPRPHGEACRYPPGRHPLAGLSPPTRGSRHGFRRARACPGSIPAHTGKPPHWRPSASLITVYPRPHGEAFFPSLAMEPSRGLSPPTRGSRLRVPRPPEAPGSIPAHTGKPRVDPARGEGEGVYPRPHGEAGGRPFRLEPEVGLSPPTRGSLAAPLRPGARPGSIPAHTGKPTARPAACRAASVYPRPHGEALSWRNPRAVVDGLSPPTRGSLVLIPRGAKAKGSIPAHTGKPCTSPP